MPKKLHVFASFLTVLSIVLAACGPAATQAPATSAPEPTKAAVEPTAAPVEPTVAPTEAPAVVEPGGTLPRNETLYFNGQQWGAVACWNPYSSSCNNGLGIAQGDNARVTMFETPYLYNMLDGKQYPLLADGDYTWNADRTELTFKIKPAAKWSDGTPVTADDVAYTWAAHAKYETNTYNGSKDYIESIEAVDGAVVIKAKLGEDGKAVNPLSVAAYVSSNYVIQKAWTQTLEARVGDDKAAFAADVAEDVVYSGPYHKFFADETKVVFVRDDNYWGQDASMWGKLPAPKYLAHAMYKDNAAGFAAFQAGEVDVSQQFNANIQDLWLKDGLPVSTYLPEAPYGIGASLPTAFFNLGIESLQNVAVRKAIAMAVDYDTIIANAMTNQSATFNQVPRSVMNPTAGEQAMYDQAAVKDLQWAGKDIGIEITTNYPEWAVYQTIVTDWASLQATPGYDIFMMWSGGAGPTQPWGRVRGLIGGEFAQTAGNWNGNWGGYKNADADAIIQAIPGMTDAAELKDAYTKLTEIYLTDVPSFTLMYRPQSFHAVNESVWTNFPHQDDGTNPPVPPMDMTDGWGVAGLYNLTLVTP